MAENTGTKGEKRPLKERLKAKEFLSLEERTRQTSSTPAYFSAGGFSSGDLRNASDKLPSFSPMPKDWPKK